MSPAMAQGIRSVGTEGLLGFVGREKGFELEDLLTVLIAFFLEVGDGFERVFKVELDGFALEDAAPEARLEGECGLGVEHGRDLLLGWNLGLFQLLYFSYKSDLVLRKIKDGLLLLIY